MTAKDFAEWGWRIPFLISVILLVFSVYIRLKLNETPIFQKMVQEGKGSKAPLTESFFHYPNNKYVLLALLGATAGQGVVWYTGQFYALFFLVITLKVDYITAYELIGLSLIIGTPFFIVFRMALRPHRPAQDHSGRLRHRGDHLLPAVPGSDALYKPGSGSVCRKEPDLGLGRSIDLQPAHLRRSVVEVQRLRPRAGLPDQVGTVVPNHPHTRSEVGRSGYRRGPRLQGWDAATWQAALTAKNFPKSADPAKINWFMTELILVIMVIYVTMVYGPIAAFLVEMFPTKIRYTSMSLPYHIGNGWFGGMLPLLATAVVAATGNIYNGLWYPIGVAVMTLVIGLVFLRDTRGVDIRTGSGVAIQKG